MEVRAFQRA